MLKRKKTSFLQINLSFQKCKSVNSSFSLFQLLRVAVPCLANTTVRAPWRAESVLVPRAGRSHKTDELAKVKFVTFELMAEWGIISGQTKTHTYAHTHSHNILVFL